MKPTITLITIGLCSVCVAYAAPSVLDGNTSVPLDGVLGVGCVVVAGAWYLGQRLKEFEVQLSSMKKSIDELQQIRRKISTDTESRKKDEL